MLYAERNVMNIDCKTTRKFKKQLALHPTLFL